MMIVNNNNNMASNNDDDDVWEDVLGNKSVMKQRIRASPDPDAPRPEFKQQALIHVIGRLAKQPDQVFVNTYATKQPMLVQIGDQILDLIPPGLMVAARLLQVGEKASVKVESRYAYGPGGCKEYSIPPDADLEYEVECLDVLDSIKEPSEMSIDELTGMVTKFKMRGNQFYEWNEFDKALKCYVEAMKFGDAANSQTEIFEALDKERAACCNNVALIYEKQGKLKESKEACVAALTLDPNNVKALVRAGRVSLMRGEHDSAALALKTALELEPANAAALQVQRELRMAVDKARRLELEAYGGFLKPVVVTTAVTPPPAQASPTIIPVRTLDALKSAVGSTTSSAGSSDSLLIGEASSRRVASNPVPTPRAVVMEYVRRLAVLLFPTLLVCALYLIWIAWSRIAHVMF
jgi:tetratricopeptide (TPR) repeat protein